MVIKVNYHIVGIVLSVIIMLTALFALLSKNSCITMAAYPEQQTVCLPILMYHEVKQNKLGKDVISPDEFEADLKYLAENDYTTITMTDLIEYVYTDAELPQNSIILSFDDGYLNTYKYVLPLLKKYDMKIVCSVIGKNVDDFTNIPDDNADYSHATWEQLREMLDSGLVEIQNHTYNLHSTTNGRIGCMQKYGESDAHYEQILTEDVNQLQEEMAQNLGITPNTFAYPYGRSSKNTIPILKSLGFKAGLSCDYGVNLITKDPDTLFALKRICRAHSKSAEKMIKEGMKTIHKTT